MSQASAKKVHMELTGESVIYNGVRQILDEMVYNICENAIKYNKEGGEIRVWVGNTLNGKKIIVTDTGIGIPKNQQERIVRAVLSRREEPLKRNWRNRTGTIHRKTWRNITQCKDSCRQ